LGQVYKQDIDIFLLFL